MENYESAYQNFAEIFSEVWPDYEVPTMNEYIHPTSDMVTRFVERFLQTINIDVNKYVQKTSEDIELEEACIDRDIAYCIGLYKGMRKFLKETTSLHQFNFKLDSLLEPTVKQTHCMFKIVQNFVLFRTKYRPTLDDIHNYYEQQADKVNKAMDEANKLASQESINLQYKTELQEKIADITSQIKKLAAKNEEQDKYINELQDKRALLDAELTPMIQQVKTLETQIEEYQEYHKMAAKLEILIKEKETLSNDGTNQILKIKVAQKEQLKKLLDADIFCESPQDLVDVLTKGHELEEKVRTTKNRIKTIKAEQKLEDQRRLEFSTKASQIEDAIQSLHVSRKDKVAVFKQEQQNVTKELNILEARKVEYDSKKAKVLADIATLRKKIATAEEEEAIIKKHWLENYSKMSESSKALHLKTKSRD